MNDDRKRMNRALQEIVVPELRERGFKGSLPHFRRFTDSKIDIMTFQFDRHGGGFVIVIATAPNRTFETHWGKSIEPNKLTANHLTRRCRIHPKGMLKDSWTGDWFRYDRGALLCENIFYEVAKMVLKNLHLAEDYWTTEGTSMSNCESQENEIEQ